MDVVLEKAAKIGINIHLNAEVKSVAESETGFMVSVNQNGSATEVEGDLVVHGAGRVPNTESLNLGEAGVDSSKQGIVVNEYLQSESNPKVYATGDAAATNGLPLTPVAGFESHIVASNLLEGNNKKAIYPAQPVVVFTIPPLAMVGLTEKQARDQGFDIKVKFRKMDGWYSYKRTNESHTAFKTIINKENGVILGAHILGEKSEEIINLFAMSINQSIRAVELKKMIYAYPSHASDIPYMI